MRKLIVIALVCLPYLAFSQEEAKFYLSFDNQSVAQVFERMETLFDVRFSFKDDNIKDKRVTLRASEWSLLALLEAIGEQSDLDFEIVEHRYILVNTSYDEIQVQELEKVVLTSYLTKGISKRKNGTFHVDPKALGILPGLTEPDILESIQLMPGVVSPNETATGFLVRAGKMDQNRMLWDGINIYHKGHLFGMISPFNPNAVKSIDFINKGTHPRYGERASSVVAIETTNDISDSLNAQVGLNGINADAFLEVPLIQDKLGVQGSFRSSYNELYQSYTFDQLADKVFESTKITESDHTNNAFEFKDYNFKLNYKPNSKHHIALSLISIDNALNYTVNDAAENKSFNDRMSIQNDGYGLAWNVKWHERLEQRTTANFSKYSLYYNFITKENQTQISDFEKRNVIYDSGLGTEFLQTLNNDQTLTFGYQYVLKDVGYAFINRANLNFVLDADKSTIQTHSAYAQYHYSKPSAIDWSLGVRATYFKELDAVRLEPRFMLFKPLFKHVKLQLSGELKHQVISEIDETIISDLSLENRLWRLANGERFPIIQSRHVSAGFIYAHSGWTLDVDGYYKRLNNITALSFGFLNPDNSQFNIGEQTIYGLDCFLRKRFDRFSTWVSYAFNKSDSRYENLNDERAFPSRSSVIHSVLTSLSYQSPKFQIALGWRFQTGKPYTESFEGTNGLEFNEGINSRRLPDYHRLDFSATYKFKFSEARKLRAKVGLSIRNVYDKRNLINREYRGNNDFNSEIEQIDKFSIGITPNLMFRLYW